MARDDELTRLRKAKKKEALARKRWERSLRSEGAKRERKKRRSSSKNKRVARRVWRKLI